MFAVFTVVHEGRHVAGDPTALAALLGPNSEFAAGRRRQPGYLGALLLTRDEPDTGIGFLLVEMWDERVTYPGAVSAPIEVDTAIAWVGTPRAFDAIR